MNNVNKNTVIIFLLSTTLIMGCSSIDIDKNGACGFVSIKTIPREDQGRVALKFKKVDDLNVGIIRKTRQLPVGKHTFTFSLGSPKNNAEYGGKKTIEINVEANVIYHVVRKPLGSDKDQYKESGKWKPVILKTEIKNCS